MVVVTSGQQYHIEKPTVALYTYINRHAGTPDKAKTRQPRTGDADFVSSNIATDRVMYVWSSHIARVKINRVRLPILLVVSRTGKINYSLSPFAPENLVSRDEFGNPVPHQPAHLHTQAESGAYLRDSSGLPRRRPFIYLNRHTPSDNSQVYQVT